MCIGFCEVLICRLEAINYTLMVFDDSRRLKNAIFVDGCYCLMS